MKIKSSSLLFALLRSTGTLLIGAQDCADDHTYRHDDNSSQTCEWISNAGSAITDTLCQLDGPRTSCPVACGVCCTDNNTAVCEEYKAKRWKNCRTAFVSELCPHMCGVCCADDDSYKFNEKRGNKGLRKCQWIKTRTRRNDNCKRGDTRWKCGVSCGNLGCATGPVTPTPTRSPVTSPPTPSPQEGELTFPRVIDSAVDGVLEMELAHRYTDFTSEVFSMTNARLLDGTLPGPTIQVNAGDTLKILYTNEMEDQNVAEGASNTFRHMDYTNLHFHGAHVSGDLPSDDVRMNILPGKTYQFETHFPATHMPGTHWVHPHVHGSTSLHVMNGAALALIVKDPPFSLPWSVRSAEEILMVVQDFDLRETQDIANAMNDGKFSYGAGTVGRADRFRLVNGQYRPHVSVRPNKWMRWRVIYAGHSAVPLNLRIESNECEMVLLAKDGVYIQDFPRTITLAPIPTAGRADLMVRCSSIGSHSVTTFGDPASSPTLTIKVIGSAVPTVTLFQGLKLNTPPYLHSLLTTLPDNGCSCNTAFRIQRRGGPFLGTINGVAYNPNESVHSIELGKVVQRATNPSQHSYHQHVYPFQIISYGRTRQSDEVQNYFQVGDWHDVIQLPGLRGDLVLRFEPREHLGLLMVHCHRLTHEDRGMMSWEYVYDNGEGVCDCNVRVGQ